MAATLERNAWLESAMAQWEVPLLRTCYLLLKDAALAEDAVQETFVKAWRGYDRFRGDAAEKTWLMHIAVNTCRDLQRSRWARHVDRQTAMEDLPEPSVAFTLPDDTITRAILSLPAALRQTVTLRYYQEMPLKEIAKVLRCSCRTVQYRLQKAERLLKAELEEWYHVE